MESLQILRYPYWGGAYDGTLYQDQLATFDFDMQDVRELLEREKADQETGLHISGSRRATFALLIEIIEWVEQQRESKPSLGASVVVWDHPSRHAPVEQLQQEYREWSKAIHRAMQRRRYLREDMVAPSHFADRFFGGYLARLVFDKKFLSCRCPHCAAREVTAGNAIHGPASCGVEEWIDWGCGGQRLFCPNDHTLLARETREFLPQI